MTTFDPPGIDSFALVNGLRLHYREYGDPHGAPLTLLHGVTMDAHGWDRFAADIGTRYRTLALTARGHGDSARAPEYGTMQNVADTVEFIDRVAGGASIVCGLSMGGVTALGLAAMHPAKVTRLVIVEAGPFTPEGRQRLETALTTAPDSWDTFEEALPAFHVGYGEDISDDALLDYMPHVLSRDADGKLRGKLDPKVVAAATPAEGGGASEEDLLWAACAAIKCPTLLIHGAKSHLISGDGMRRMAKTIPDARFVEVDSGHAVPLENPDAFYHAVADFL